MRAWASRIVVLVALTGGGAAGCVDDSGPVALHRAAPSPEVQAPAAAGAAARVSFELVRAEQRLAQELPPPDRPRQRPCPDAALGDLDVDDRTLVLVSRDARPKQRHVLPLQLRRHLESDELGPIRRHFAAVQDPGAQRYAPRFAAPEAAAAALDELLALNRRPLFGVYQVTHYRAPKRIHKLGRRRPEWRTGECHAWLVVYDTRVERPLCQTLIMVQNDTRGASLSIRQRSDTRDRLVAQLGQLVRERSRAALGGISSALELPAP